MYALLVFLAVVFGVAVVGTLGVFGVIFLVRMLGLIGRLVAHVFRTLGAIIADTFRAVGALFVALVLIPLIPLNVVVGRWSAASHFGRALSSELTTLGLSLYRVTVGHPVRLVGLGALTEGLERRLPRAFADVPPRDRPRKASGMFEGYEIVGSLKGGGSGGQLYVAAPDAMKQAAFERRGLGRIERVVIKSFSLGDGSSLPQIVRESRALDAARKLGLVLEHELGDERFHYVMRYVPGEHLATVTDRLHARSEPSTPPGLDRAALREGLGYVGDLLETLDMYHRHGLWHKDVKPENIIIDPADTGGAGPRAHLVDFGLITPLRSAMTLTTHGTEYYRDPEMVRQALKGAKVHQIDGARFDVFSAGAVLFALVEAGFPAHGGLSSVSKHCPEAVKWIIRRAMTDYDKRYATAGAMLEDLRVVQQAEDPFAVKPADLPSMGGALIDAHDIAEPAPEPEAAWADAEPVAPAAQSRPQPPASVDPRRLRVADWWTGRYAVAREAGVAPPPPAYAHAAHASRVPVGERKPAAEQLKSARKRVAATRRKAASRIRRRHEAGGLNGGVVIGLLVVIGFVLFVAIDKIDEANAPAGAPRVQEGDPSFIDSLNPLAARERARSDVEAARAEADAARAEADAARAEADAARREAEAYAESVERKVRAAVAPPKGTAPVLLISSFDDGAEWHIDASVRESLVPLKAAGFSFVGAFTESDTPSPLATLVDRLRDTHAGGPAFSEARREVLGEIADSRWIAGAIVLEPVENADDEVLVRHCFRGKTSTIVVPADRVGSGMASLLLRYAPAPPNPPQPEATSGAASPATAVQAPPTCVRHAPSRSHGPRARALPRAIAQRPPHAAPRRC